MRWCTDEEGQGTGFHRQPSSVSVLILAVWVVLHEQMWPEHECTCACSGRAQICPRGARPNRTTRDTDSPIQYSDPLSHPRIRPRKGNETERLQENQMGTRDLQHARMYVHECLTWMRITRDALLM